jgi:hypothetical protein
LEPVVAREERRGGNKSVTRIKGLETYGVNPTNVAKELRKSFAASTTVNDIPGTKSAKGTPVSDPSLYQYLHALVLIIHCSFYLISYKR